MVLPIFQWAALYETLMFFFCYQRGNEVASVGGWLACPSYITQRVPNSRRGLGLLWLHCAWGQIWHFWGFLCQIRWCCRHVFHLKEAEKSVSDVWRTNLCCNDAQSRVSRQNLLLILLIDKELKFEFWCLDLDTTCRTMSDRISTKQLMAGWQPSARIGSSWVETNPTWLTWWGPPPDADCLWSNIDKSVQDNVYIHLQCLYNPTNPFHLSAGSVWCPKSDGGPAGIWWYDEEHQGQTLVQAHGKSVTQPWGAELKCVYRHQGTSSSSSLKRTELPERQLSASGCKKSCFDCGLVSLRYDIKAADLWEGVNCRCWLKHEILLPDFKFYC